MKMYVHENFTLPVGLPPPSMHSPRFRYIQPENQATFCALLHNQFHPISTIFPSHMARLPLSTSSELNDFFPSAPPDPFSFCISFQLSSGLGARRVRRLAFRVDIGVGRGPSGPSIEGPFSPLSCS